jgi:hypothetical protein
MAAPEPDAALFLRALPLLLANEAASQAVGDAAARALTWRALAAALPPEFCALADALRSLHARASLARAHARVACICAEARRVADAPGPAAPPGRAAVRAVQAIARALAERRLLPRAAPELLAMVQQLAKTAC